MKLARWAAAVGLALHAAAAHAQEFKAGDISVEKPWSRATPKGAQVAGGYMVIFNRGARPDKLIGASSDFAGTAQIHEMSMTGAMMDMHELVSGLEIPAHGKVSLTPNRLHIMFTGLRKALAKGQTVKATLRFARAGKLPVELKIGGIGDRGPPL